MKLFDGKYIIATIMSINLTRTTRTITLVGGTMLCTCVIISVFYYLLDINQQSRQFFNSVNSVLICVNIIIQLYHLSRYYLLLINYNTIQQKTTLTSKNKLVFKLCSTLVVIALLVVSYIWLQAIDLLFSGTN